MPFPVCTVGSTGDGFCLCCSKKITVTVIVGIPTILAMNLPTAYLGGIVLADCGCVATIITGNPLVLALNLPKARVGDLFLGGDPTCVGPIGTMSTGIPTVLA